MNLFDVENPTEGERFDTLVQCRNVVVERIASSSEVDGQIYDQEQDEWVALIRGTATLELGGIERSLSPGENVFIPAHKKHRVVACSKDALWLAVHVHPTEQHQSCDIVEGSFADIAALDAQIPEFDEHYTEVQITERVGTRPHLALVAKIADQTVGYKLGYEEAAGRFYSWLGGVLPAFRRHGIAQQLLDAQEKWCREHLYNTLSVKTENQYRKMVALLVRNRYDVFGVQMNGTIILRKRLT